MTIEANFEANIEELVGSYVKMNAVFTAVTKDIASRLRISESQIKLLTVSGSVKMVLLVSGIDPNKGAELSTVKDITIPTVNGTVTHKVSYLVTKNLSLKEPPPEYSFFAKK
jgi:hypothetical protein